MAQEQQVFSEAAVAFGQYTKLFWTWAGVNSVVPPNKILEITTLTLSYFPSGAGTVGRADIAGRNSLNNAVWRIQVVYAYPKQTLHLPFPKPLRLEAGGYVQIGFVVDGPGTIFISANGRLMDQVAGVAEQSTIADLIGKLDTLQKSGSITEQEFMSLRANLEHTYPNETVAPF